MLTLSIFQDFSISSTFNIEDLVNYNCPDFDPNNPLDDEPSLEPISKRHSLPPLEKSLTDDLWIDRSEL